MSVKTMRIGKELKGVCPVCQTEFNYWWTDDHKELFNGKCGHRVSPEHLGIRDFETWQENDLNFHFIKVESKWGESKEDEDVPDYKVKREEATA